MMGDVVGIGCGGKRAGRVGKEGVGVLAGGSGTSFDEGGIKRIMYTLHLMSGEDSGRTRMKRERDNEYDE
jgi:hypothetical protein